MWFNLLKRRPRRLAQETYYHAVRATPWLDGVKVDDTPEFGFRIPLKVSMSPCPHTESWIPCPEGKTEKECLYFKCSLADCGCRFHFKKPGDPRYNDAVSAIMYERTLDFNGRDTGYYKGEKLPPRLGRDIHSLGYDDD
jgi:hypothetical protein